MEKQTYSKVGQKSAQTVAKHLSIARRTIGIKANDFLLYESLRELEDLLVPL